jgi:hypothetical protein
MRMTACYLGTRGFAGGTAPGISVRNRPVGAALIETMRLQTAYRTVGQSGEGDDRCLALAYTDRVVIAVADGAGGTARGAEAAAFVVDLVNERSRDGRFDVVELLRTCDVQLAQSGSGGETTAVVAVVDDNGIIGASVGDSGAWIVDATTHLDLTRGQVRSSARRSADHKSNVILKLTGSKPHVVDQPFRYRFKLGCRGYFSNASSVSVLEQPIRCDEECSAERTEAEGNGNCAAASDERLPAVFALRAECSQGLWPKGQLSTELLEQPRGH